MIRIEGTRFGVIEVDDAAAIHFAHGLIGFPEENSFILVERGESRPVAYLQSLKTAGLAFPVADGQIFGGEYPTPAATVLAAQAGIECSEPAVLVIVAVNEQKTLDANLLAPIIVDVETRAGLQAVLDPRTYSAATSLADPVAAAKARMDAIKAEHPNAEDGEPELQPAEKLAVAVG